MNELNIKSNISFLYYKDYELGNYFVSTVLGLTNVLDQGWASVYKMSDNSYLGVVKAGDGSISTETKGSFLISLTVDNLNECFERIKSFENQHVFELTEINAIKEISLESFFFKCGEGNDFEIQQFNSEEMKSIFE
jgi:hypothetical protein